ncbi:Vgb family protein [Acidomonas methanolica]|uniref:Uncharacterized protein n=1 Tax=Acidomonas methanolica NBRC 104435 TaxID=1231351 RepID=A0A023D911_ACIMT|nr:YncE family protein [Acidomonas methanolica]MBU2655564.1 YncE family protein [Acidomonas methanolica]TCS21571.1 streptogramin lyase [Acidomonas methanolica]GAJ30618.1 hypothetical protein Amme_210_009 [Acidomonas methanolica NBRC 104435]GEL00369.1 hypothetical protein AME01nite_28670 [Acidomonas methanolica NBRC 104435]
MTDDTTRFDPWESTVATFRGLLPLAMIGFSLALAGCAAGLHASAAYAPQEHVQTVPGFADFIAVDGPTVWMTNRGRVEHWSLTGKIAQVALPHPCGAMAIGYGSLWVADCHDATLDRIDLKTARLSARIKTGIANPRGETNVVIGNGSVWIASDRTGAISRIDPESNTVTARIPVDADTYYLSYGLGALWATSPTRRSLEKIDPQTNRVVMRTALGGYPGFLVAGEGAVWIQEQADGTVVRVNPENGVVTGRVKVETNLKYGDIDAGGGNIWLRTTTGQTFAVIDPQSLVIRSRVGKPTGSGALRYTSSGLWTTSHDIHTLSLWTPVLPPP